MYEILDLEVEEGRLLKDSDTDKVVLGSSFYTNDAGFDKNPKKIQSASIPQIKSGADLLFQVISLRYEQSALVITSNRAFKDWPEIFNNDSRLTSDMLDRLLHHAETILIEGKSYRMKEQIEV